jgi:peroxiredoxin
LSMVAMVLTVLSVLLASVSIWFGLRLAMQNGRLLIRIESLEAILFAKPGSIGLAPGSTLGDFSLPLVSSGGTMTLSQWRGKKVVLIFTRLGCHHSEQMLPQLSVALANAKPGGPVPLVISMGDLAGSQRLFERHPITCPVLSDEESETVRHYRVAVTPMALVVDERGAVEGNVVIGTAAILDLFREGTARGEQSAEDYSKVSSSLSRSKLVRDGLKAGTTAPEFRLPTLTDGQDIALADLQGRPLLLVFSDPNCGPCQQLAPKLEEVHQSSPDLQLVMISRGDRDVNREKATKGGVTFPVALQAHWEVSKAYGMFATPSGYLVDEHGVLASDVAVGGDAILRLVAQRQAGGSQPGAEPQVPAALNT